MDKRRALCTLLALLVFGGALALPASAAGKDIQAIEDLDGRAVGVVRCV